ncbi:CYTH domain-containing protein [Candidatus Woesearchaeota archaeon]|nr:MAG: CYTH domain-containing protein [Candidatus Woesearchaeota archaeon]
MKIETEAKIKLESFETLFDKLPKLNFRIQKNAYFKLGNDIVRVREDNGKIFLNRKAKAKQKTEFKAMIEDEIEVKNVYDVFKFLKFSEVLAYEKKRADIRLSGCIVSLDVLPNGSSYLEIEGDESDIKTVVKFLELENVKYEMQSYLEILTGVKK